jgi:bifunctional non-homologous end joining protein LigD
MARAIEDGKVEVVFEGERIKGGYALVEMRKKDEDRRNWLLIKLKDEHVGSLPEDLEKEGESVATGRTIEDLKRASSKRRAR